MLFSRPDGTRARDVPPYRRIMPFIMRGRNESAAYFDQEIDLTRTQAFLAAWNARSAQRITLFHVFLWATVQTLGARPRLNRFVSGWRLYDRDGIWVSYSAKKALHDDAPVVVLKRRFAPDASFADVVAQLHADLAQGRSEARSHVDKELGLLLALPVLLVRFFVWLQRLADAWNLLPGAFIRNDPLYASAFLANLGSLKMDPVHHHLYEYGNIPIFACVGRSHDAPTVGPDGAVGTRLVCRVKYTFDERIEDGLYCAGALDALRRIVEDPIAAGAALPPPSSAAQPPLRHAS